METDKSMNVFSRHILPCFAVLLCLFIPLEGSRAFSQSPQEKAAPEKSDSVVILPFETTRITEALTASNALILESAKKHYGEEEVKRHRRDADTIFSAIEVFFSDSMVVNMKESTMRDLELIDQRIGVFMEQIKESLSRYNRQTMELEAVIQSLDRDQQRWKLTLDTGAKSAMPQSRVERIGRTLERLDSLKALLERDMSLVLSLQDSFAEAESQLEMLKEKVDSREMEISQNMFSRDMPGLFGEFKNLKDPNQLERHREVLMKNLQSDFRVVQRKYGVSLVFALLFMVVMGIFAIKFKQSFGRVIPTDRFTLTERHMTMINSPLAVTLFTANLLVRFLLPGLPLSIHAVNILIMIVPMAILLVRLYGTTIRLWIIVLVAEMVLIATFQLAYAQTIYIRLLLLLISMVALWLFAWVIVKKPLLNTLQKDFMGVLFRILWVVFALMCFVAIVANFAGAFQLAELFSTVPVEISLLAIAILVTIRLTDVLVFLILANKFAQRVNVIREDFEFIYKKLSWLIDLFLWLFFISAALNIFRLREAVFEWGRGLFSDGIKIGAVDITLGSILIFIFVIWLSVMISRILARILEKDVFTRVQTAKGMPSTILLLLKIVLITGGFFLAAAAAGMELTNLSIVLGAFSVGIGFGLQNIFNNMVSGLILAFERPIKVGDIVQVGQLVGEVRSIGLRSSTVKSFDGAEVIVPNGNLISNEMINWTKSDNYRRMDIRIGVAYGTDPDKVLEILEVIAQEHKKVRKHPVPRAYFDNFGDSSLDFRLLAWVHIDDRLGTESEIRQLINQRLAEAGIEIPFPQTDLHLRSDDTRNPAE